MFCFKSDVKEPVDEYDRIPLTMSVRMKFGKRSTDPLTGRLAIKLGGNRFLQIPCCNAEYHALNRVGQHTSIPIYKVKSIFNRPEGKLVVYEASQGQPLDNVWPSLSAQQRQRLVKDLASFIEQLRKMEPPKYCVVGDSTYGGVHDGRFGTRNVGPFYTIDDFHRFERRGHSVDDFPEEQIKLTHDPLKPYMLNFTHARMCPQNILVDRTGRVCALTGWESAGWYPEYWEYTQMCHMAPKTMQDWLEAMCEAMPRYDQELVCEEALRARYSRSIYDMPVSVRAPSPSPTELRREITEIDDLNTEHTSG